MIDVSPRDEPPVIAVQGLTKRYGGRAVVDGLDLTVPKGAIYGFLGPNGSGKTTTIRMVCGLLKPDAGSGQCLGFNVLTESALIKARIGYMTQRFSLYEDLSIRENLEFICRLYSMDRLQERVNAALSDLGLSGRSGQIAGRLSGGWKQRLALAACMIHEPQLLLLDEPTAGVDPKARRDFWDQIRAYARGGVTTLVSTHYMDEAVQCDSIAFIAYGKKMIDAPTLEIPSHVGLSVYRVVAESLDAAEALLRQEPAFSLVARFGGQIHAAGGDAEAASAAAQRLRASGGLLVEPIPTGLEEAFIHLMANASDNFK